MSNKIDNISLRIIKISMELSKVYFIGIGGISLSGMAMFLKGKGVSVSGSDRYKTQITSNLENCGIKVYYSHKASHVKDVDAVVYTDAIAKDNKELLFAKKNGIKIYKRGEFLAKIMSEFKTSIAVCGCHGKTTTTAMLSCALKEFSPTSHIGGIVNGKSFILGEKKLFITEACEYKRNFLYLKPSIGVILNIGKDHMDCYKNLQNLVSAFQTFANQSKTLVINGDDNNCKKIIHENKITFGFKNTNDFYLTNIKEDKNNLSAKVFAFGKFYSDLKLNVGVKHNLLNALASMVCAYILKAKYFNKNILTFTGTQRRNEFVKAINGGEIYHDYAHHPKEIEKIIAHHKKFCEGRLIIVFESHTYSRTKALLNEFKTCFKKADKLFVLPIYPAREKKIKGVTGKALAKEIGAYYIKNYKSCKARILKEIKPKDEVLLLGAGTIVNLSKMF